MAVIHGDALEIVGNLGEFDYLITDPPYPPGASAQNTQRGEDKYSALAESRVMAENMSLSLVMAVIRSVRKSPTFACWIMTDHRQISFYAHALRAMGLHRQSCVIWHKGMGMGVNYRNAHEMILFATAYHKRTDVGPNVVSVKRVHSSKRTHTFEKPADLVETICAKFPQGRVIDPFCGTGGLLVGAKRLGWDVTGVDMGREYCDTANERIERESVQERLIDFKEGGNG